MTTATVPSRREALKARHRAAILAAARELVQQRGGPHFNVDELAARADVARRTVFNHFASVDDILITLCDDALDILIDDFIAVVAAVPVGDGSRQSMFSELAVSLRTSDLPGAIAGIALILGGPGANPKREDNLSNRAFERATDRLLAEVRLRHPGADPFDAELLVGSLMNGVMVAAKFWVYPHGIRLNAAGRAEWLRLIDRLIVSMRSGYLLAT